MLTPPPEPLVDHPHIVTSRSTRWWRTRPGCGCARGRGGGFAGVLLLFRQPFRSGDQISVVDQSGTVTEINIRETRMTTFDGESVIIPNRDVYKNVILVHTPTVLGQRPQAGQGDGEVGQARGVGGESCPAVDHADGVGSLGRRSPS